MLGTFYAKHLKKILLSNCLWSLKLLVFINYLRIWRGKTYLTKYSEMCLCLFAVSVKARPMSEILDRTNKMKNIGLKVKCETPPDVSICVGNNIQNVTEFRDMEVVDVYQERYLLANSILESQSEGNLLSKVATD